MPGKAQPSMVGATLAVALMPCGRLIRVIPVHWLHNECPAVALIPCGRPDELSPGRNNTRLSNSPRQPNQIFGDKGRR